MKKRPVGRPPKNEDNRLWYEKLFGSVIQFISSKEFIFLFTIAAMLPMIFHSTLVYHKYVPDATNFIVYTYAIVLDAATLIAVLRARLDKDGIAWFSTIYALMSFAINICLLFTIPDWVGKGLIAFMIPYTIIFFSHEIPKINNEYGRDRN